MQVHPGVRASRESRSLPAPIGTFAEVIAEASQTDWLQLSAPDAMQQISADPPFILDVRTRKEWEERGHIANAVLVPVTDLADNLDALPADADTPILVYCAGGTRSFYGTILLKLLGYANVKNIAGGMGAWASAGLPVAR